jgi:hypothetical protein
MAIGFALGIMEAYNKDELFNNVAWSWYVNE